MSYKEDRESAYPSIADQLDQIHMDLKKSSNLKDGEWYKTIQAIKATYEKPIVEKE